jgi:FtsZ-binding cell division protein ZapB
LSEAITIYLENESNPRARNHVLEEACDNVQVILSTLKLLGIEIEELINYWNTEHIEKMQFRPRIK